MPLTPGTRLGPYEVIGALGAGGMGEVYRARDTSLNRDVAIKTLPVDLAGDEDRLMRFQREAEALAALNHSNIAQIYAIEREDAAPFIVMELVIGRTLEEILGAPEALPSDEALDIARQIAGALEAAHDAGIVHRDLKPANVKVRPDGTVKVLDFGLAKALGQDPSATAGTRTPSPSSDSPTMTSPALTAMGLILGTAAYMSPEQAKGRPVDRRADIWAFGCVLYEMLTGQRLFAGETVGELIADVLRADIDLSALPAATPPAVRRLVARCLDRDPRTRLQHIGEARIALTQLDDASDLAVPVAAGAQPPAMPSWRQPATWLLAAGLAVVVGGLTWWMTRPAPGAPQPVTRFEVALPEGDDFFNPTSREIALSPAGTAIAFEWNQQLWIRRLEERQSSVLVPGVTDVREPFFSPDGSHIGFFSNERMMRVAASGGPPEVIGGPIPGRPLGVRWATDGYIYVGIGGNIARLPETGGVPETVIEVEPGEQASGPQLLPDGDWLLYSLLSRQADWDEAQVVAEHVTTGERRVLVGAGRAGRITSTGHLLYAFGGTLYGQAFDIDAIAVTGGPVPLVSDIRSGASNFTGASFFDVTPRGDLIYVEGATGPFSPTALAWLDRTGRETPLPFEPQPFVQVQLSPNGRQIAAAVRPSAQQSDILLYAADRPGSRRLPAEGQAEAPVWSPDGTWLYYLRLDPNSRDRNGVYRQRADLSGTAELLLPASDPTMPWSISSDGQRMAVVVYAPQGLRIGIVSLDGDPALQQLSIPGSADKPSLSPDGRFVAYQVDTGGELAVYVMEIASGRSQMVSAGDGQAPKWSFDGREILFWSDADMKAVRVVSAETLEFTTPVTLFTRPSHRNEFDVTRDGQRILHVVRHRADEPAGVRIQVVLNWFAELTAKVPR